MKDLLKEFRYDIAYILVELSVKIAVDDDVYDDKLDVRKECPLWVKLRVWISWQLYQNGCRLYT